MKDAKTMGGEAAFPSTVLREYPNGRENVYSDRRISEGGLTRREYFAGLAMQGIAALKDERVWRSDSGESIEAWRARLFADDAAMAVDMADALLSALAKESDQ